jgi:hypothetical protein
MGTSQSSNGSPAGVPMVPPWVPDLSLPEHPADGADSDSSDQSEEQPAQEQTTSDDPNQTVPIAPSVRFGGAKRSLGDYVRTGDKASMRKGLGQYVKKGYGGSSIATRRMAGTAQVAQGLYSALASGPENPFAFDGGALDPASMAGKTAYEMMDAVVEVVRPVDGTQDTEASRASIKDALSNVLNLYPDADLTNLSEKQRDLAIELFVAGDVFRRIDLDLGKYIREKAPSATTAMGRLKEVREYVRETVASAFNRLRSVEQNLTGNTVTQIVQNAIRETCEVFEGYAK